MTLAVAKLISFDFMKWELALLAFLVLVAVFIWRGKGIKSAVMFLLVTVALLCTSFFTKCLVVLAIEEPTEAVRLGIAWVPTVEFTLVIFFSTLLGIQRGFRKSAILMIQSVCAAAVCIGLYFFFINSEAVDGLLLKVANLFTGDFAEYLGVSAECSTMREVLAEYLPGILGGYGTEVSIILGDNGAYLMTLVDAAYHIVFGLLCYLIYLFLVFILYIVYHCAYSERKYKQRKAALVASNKTDSSYRKRSTAGGILGFVRGLTAGLISLSFMGSLLFIAAGGTGNGTLGEYSFGNEKYDFGYSVYRSVEDYGNHGIFKLLNKFKGTDDSPYYLFAADLIFSGGLEDENTGINANIKLRKELGAYTGFARETMSLLLKHGEDVIKPILLNEYGGDKTEAIIEVMCRPEFQAEFETLIDGFEAQTYIINFALSAVNSLIAELDNTSFAGSVSETNCEMLKLLFKPGYLSPYIPDEASGKTGNGQPYLNFANLFRKSDAKILYRLVVSVLTFENNDTGEMKTVEMVNDMLPHIEQLSLLSDSRGSEFNPVLTRLYCFLANVYLDGTNGKGVEYGELKNENVKWISEINSLLSVWGDGYKLIKTATESEGSSLENLLSLFDKGTTDYKSNLAAYDNCCEALANSKLLGKVIATDYMQEQFIYELFRAVSDDVYIPQNLTYENVYDGSGNLLEHGEMYRLLRGLRLIGTEEDYREFIQSAIDGEELGFTRILDMFSGFADVREGYDNSLSGYATESGLLRSLISAIMIEMGGDVLSVPYAVCEQGTNGRIIEKSVLADLFAELCNEKVVEALKTIEDASVEDVLKNEAITGLLKKGNGILEGTVANLLLSGTKDNPDVVIPSWLKMPEGGGSRDIPENWLTDKRGFAGEIRKLADVLDYIDISALLGDGESAGNIADQILDRKWTEDELNTVFASDILHFSASKRILSDSFDLGGGFTMIVPKDACTYLSGEDVARVVNIEELVTVLSKVSELDINSDSSATDILRELNSNRKILDSYIISASMANFIASEEFLSLPAVYERAAQKEELEERGGAYSWQRELTRLLDAIDALFDLDGEEDIDFSNEGLLEQKLNERLSDFNTEFKESGKTRLEYCCASEIVLHNITDKIDEAIKEWGITRTENSSVLLFENEESLKPAKKYNTFCASWYYTHAELEPLVNSVKVFGLEDFFGTNADGGGTKEDISAKAEERLLTLNDGFEEGGGTKLDAVYGSYIIRAIISNEVDGVFTSDRIVIDTRNSLKYDDNTYFKEEMSNAVTAVGALTDGIDGETTADKVNKLEFENLKFVSDNLDDLYVSKLVAACITKSIQEKGHSTLVHHDKAYIEDYAIYKESEVRSIIDIAGTEGTAENFGINDLDKIKQHIGKSYLIDASLTVNILNKKDITVPMTAVTEDGVIKPDDMVALLDAFNEMSQGNHLTDWNGITVVPDIEHREKIAASVILRATVANKVTGDGWFISAANAEKSNVAVRRVNIAQADESKFVIVPNVEQTRAMLNVLQSGEEFELPPLTVENLKDIDEDTLELYIACDMLKFRICELLYTAQEYGMISGYEFGEEKVWNLSSGEERTAYSLTNEEIQNAIGELR